MDEKDVLAPFSKAVVFALPADSASDQPREARDVLEEIAAGLRVAAAAAVYYRFLLGRQLCRIRDQGLWRTPELQAAGVPAPSSWDAWTRTHFQVITQLSRESGYGAMQIASCKAMSSLEEPQLRSFPALANAILLSRVERRDGVAKAQELLPQAMALPMNEFRELAGAPTGCGQTGVVTRSPAAARALDRIGRRLKDADQDALDSIGDLLDGEIASICGDNPDDIATFLLAALQHELQAQAGEKL